MEATPRNMRAFEQANPGRDGVDNDGNRYHVEGRRCFAYSPVTGERYSASAGDYWSMPDDEPLMDSAGEPMILATEGSIVEPVADDLPTPQGTSFKPRAFKPQVNR